MLNAAIQVIGILMSLLQFSDFQAGSTWPPVVCRLRSKITQPAFEREVERVDH